MQCSATGSIVVQIYIPTSPSYTLRVMQSMYYSLSHLYISSSTPVNSSKDIDVVQKNCVHVNCNNMFCLSIQAGFKRGLELDRTELEVTLDVRLYPYRLASRMDWAGLELIQ